MTVVKVESVLLSEPNSFDKEEVSSYLISCSKHKSINKWNSWREKNILTELDLSKFDFSGLDLRFANLQGCDFNFCDFSESVLEGASFTASKLEGSKFNDCELIEVDLSNANLVGVDFAKSKMILALVTNADLTGANLSFTDLSAANFKGTSLKGVNLEDAKLKGTIFSECDLRVANLPKIDLHDTIFDGISLTGSNLQGSDLSNIDLTGLNLTGTILKEANLTNANLESMHLSGINFSKATLNGANLSSANLDKANFTNAQLLGVDFTDASLVEANLMGANLENAYCKGANFEEAILQDAVLAEADFRVSNLMNANLAGADMIDINLSGAMLEGTGLNIQEEVVEEITQSDEINEVKEILADLNDDKEVVQKVEEEIIKADVEVEAITEPSIVVKSEEKSITTTVVSKSTSFEDIMNYANSFTEFSTVDDIYDIVKKISFKIEYENTNLNSKFTGSFLEMARLYQESTYLSYLAYSGKQEEMIRLNKREQTAFRLEFDIIDSSVLVYLTEDIKIFINDMFDTYKQDKAANTLFSIFIISGYMSIKEIRDYLVDMNNIGLRSVLQELIQRYKLSRTKDNKIKAILHPLYHDAGVIAQTAHKRYTSKEYILLKNHSSKREELKIEGEFLVDGASGLSTSTPTFYLLNDGVEYKVELTSSDEDRAKSEELISRLQKTIFSTISIERVDGSVTRQRICEIEVW